MRRRQVLWRIFFWVKKIVYRKFNVFPNLIYSGRFRNIGLNKDYKFFIGNEIIKTGNVLPETAQLEGIADIKARITPIIKNNEFCFLNKSIPFHNNIEWQSNEYEKLWLYNLHYFDYAFELGLAYLIENKSDAFETFKSLAADWIDKNRRIGCGYGWEPYPLSLRIVNWIYAYNLFSNKIDEDLGFKTKYLESAAIQTEFLCNNVERHVRRNHLIKNGKALFLAGLFFQGAYASKWKTKGGNILIEETEEQILADGGHYERSPMYHLIVLQDYLEMFILSQRNNVDFPVAVKLKKMLFFLAAIIHPDNQIPLLNDSAFDIAKESGEIFFTGAYFLDCLPDYDDLCKTTPYTFLLTGMTAVGKRQWAVGKRQLAVGSWQLAKDSGQLAKIKNPQSKIQNPSWQLAKDSWQLAVGSWQKTVGSWQKSKIRNLKSKIPVGSWQKTELRKEKALTETSGDSSNPQPSTLFTDSGFCVIRSDEKNDKFMIISCKDPSPYYSPGHSHSDMLSYELSLGNKRFIVDSGAYNYSGDKWRGYFRSARAHNTLTVNGQDQSELWGTFGIARRAGLRAMRLNTANNNAVLFEGSFEGFPGLNAICHERSIYFIDNLFWFIFDAIKGDCADLLSYKVESLIHIHPDRYVEFAEFSEKTQGIIISNREVMLHVCPVRINSNSRNNDELKLKIVSGDEDITQGWYSPEFGSKIKNSVIVISNKGRLPIYSGYVLFPSDKTMGHISASCRPELIGYTGSGGNTLNLEVKALDCCYFIKKEGVDIYFEKHCGS